jgi:hypothetical protein
MAIAPIFRNLRIIPREADYLNKKYGSRGEIFFDRAANSLKLFDGENRGGTELARSDLVNVSDAVFVAKATAAGVGGGSGSIEVSDTAPTSPNEGTIWFDSTTAKIYVYLNDGTSSQWVQPVAPIPGSILDLGITDGTDGQILSTDGSGNFSFIDNFDGTWSSLTGTPTTLSGYGITDAFDGQFSSLSNTPTTIAGYGITDAFDGEFSSLANKPTTLAGYGIVDAQQLLVSGTNIKTINGASLLGSGDITITAQAANTGNVVFTGYTIDSDDSSALTFTPSLVMQSDLSVENDLTVRQDAIIENNLSVLGEFTTQGSGIPEIFSDNEIQLSAGDRVVITASPLQFASFTQAEVDALLAENGDLLYNSTTNTFQGYANGSWVDLN